MLKAIAAVKPVETGVLKDMVGLGVLLILIASVQLLSFVAGA